MTLALSAIFVVGFGYAVVDWIDVTEGAAPTNPGGPLACLGLVGASPEFAETRIEALGYPVIWHLTRTTDGEFGRSDRVDTRPSGIVHGVWFVGDDVLIEVTPAGDPLADVARVNATAELARPDCQPH